MDARFTALVERMQARDAQRTAENAKRHEEKQYGEESAATFLNDFAHRRSTLEASLQSYINEGGAESCDEQQLVSKITELEQSLASAAYFLPSYDLRLCSTSLTQLTERIDSAIKSRKAPAKFAFSSMSKKKKKVKTMDGGQEQQETAATTITTTTDLEKKCTENQISGLRDQQITIPSSDGNSNNDINAGGTNDIQLSDLKRCSIHLRNPLGALFAHDLEDCTVTAGPIDGAFHLENTRNSTFHITARQVRIHSAQHCDFYLDVKTGPIIEHSAGLRFGKLKNDHHQDTSGDGTKTGEESWRQVQDFGWLRTTPSPNWSLI